MAGGAIVPRPDRVPIDAAHGRLDDGVRRGSASPVRFQQLADAHETPATNAQHYAYDSTTGLFVPVDPPDIIWNATQPPTVSISAGVTPKNTINVVGFSMTIPDTVSAGTTTAKLWKNGTAGTLVATVSIASGSTYGHTAVSPAVTFDGRGDYYQVELTALGTGAGHIGGGIELG